MSEYGTEAEYGQKCEGPNSRPTDSKEEKEKLVHIDDAKATELVNTFHAIDEKINSKEFQDMLEALRKADPEKYRKQWTGDFGLASDYQLLSGHVLLIARTKESERNIAPRTLRVLEGFSSRIDEFEAETKKFLKAHDQDDTKVNILDRELGNAN